MKIDKLLLKYLAKQFGISEDAAAELLYTKSEDNDTELVLKPDALKLILEKDKLRVNALKSTAVDKTKIYDEAYAEAKKSVLGKAEKALAEKYGIEGDSFKLNDLVDKIVAKNAEATKPGDLDESTVKKHPLYLALEKNSREELDKLKTDYETKVKNLQTETQRAETLKSVTGEVLAQFDNLKPVLSKTATKAAKQRADFAKKFANFNYQLDEAANDYILLDSEGKRIEDEHGNPVYLKSKVNKVAADFYDFEKQTEKGGAGNENQGGGGNVTVPKNEDEYATAMFNASTSKEREEIAAAYEASNK